ncbi:MAG: ribonuclease III [Patescibacteria group bacterium]
MNISKLEKTIEYEFKNRDLLKEALTHRSYLNENPRWSVPHNERLEFLGDAVMELAVTEELYNRYPKKPEGELTPIRAALVNHVSLALAAKEIELESFVLLSRGEKKDTHRSRDAILANATEALIGAVYLDSNYATIKKFINKFIMAHLDTVLKEGSYRDAKSLLQEKLQAEDKITPIYKILEQEGPEHQKYFKVGVFSGKKQLATGEGYSKQEAELAAAAEALSSRPS